MNDLNREFLKLKGYAAADYPEKVLLFGEGNFLRAFACFIVEKLNEKGYGASVVALQGVETGLSDVINGQEGLYTVIERGMEKGGAIERFNLITCLKRCVNPYSDYDKYMEIAKNPDLQAIISNTTEFGICYSENEDREKSTHENFPAKLTHFLYERFRYFKGDPEKGLAILPCELIDKNGEKLKEIVLRYAKEWELEEGFIGWLEEANSFANTLVDRIVSGYPKGEAEAICSRLGYNDKLLDVCEPFLLWVVEADRKILNKIPLEESGLDIIVTDDLTPYRTRKVRILNGAHTMSVLAGYLCGFEIVEQLVKDDVFGRYIKRGIFEEIIPSFSGSKLEEYAFDVLERFKNPYLNHKLISISLNSVSKFKARVLPSIKDFVRIKDRAPAILSFSLAALIAFYKEGIGKFVNDEKQYVDRLNAIFEQNLGESKTVKAVLSEKLLWDEDLTQINYLEESVAASYKLICEKGIKAAVEEVSNG